MKWSESFRKQGRPLEGVYDDDREVSDGPPVVTEDQLKRSRLLNSEGLEVNFDKAKFQEMLIFGLGIVA